MTVRRAFRGQGVDRPLRVARDGVEGLEVLRGMAAEGAVPPVVLLDLNMPRLNGLEFLQTVRADPRLCIVSVFVLTTSANESDITEAYRLNVSGYLVKPTESEQFTEAVATLDRFWSLCELPSQWGTA